MAKYVYCALESVEYDNDGNIVGRHVDVVDFARAYYAAYCIDARDHVISTGYDSNDTWACKYLGDEYARLKALARRDFVTADKIRNGFRVANSWRAQDMNSCLNESGIHVAMVESPKCAYMIEYNDNSAYSSADGEEWMRGCWSTESTHATEAIALMYLETLRNGVGGEEWDDEAHTSFSTDGIIHRVMPDLTEFEHIKNIDVG